MAIADTTRPLRRRAGRAAAPGATPVVRRSATAALTVAALGGAVPRRRALAMGLANVEARDRRRRPGADRVHLLGGNLSKIHHGGWLPLVIAGGVFTLVTTWHRTLLRPKHAIVLDVSHKPFKDDVAEAGRRVALNAGFDPVAVLDAGHGRIASAVLEHARRPVLVAPPAAAPFRRNEPIFMCYDGSREARHALVAAGDLLAGRTASVAAFMPAVDDLALLRSSLPWSVGPEVQDRLAGLDRQEADAPPNERARGPGSRQRRTSPRGPSRSRR